MTDDGDHWIETLAGRTTAANEDGREAAALRRRMLDRPRDASPAVPAVDTEREMALLERARRDGLLPGPTADRHGGTIRNAHAWASKRTLAAAAAVVLAIGLTLSWQGRTPVETVRGVDNGIVRIIAADPAALKQQLIAELVATGVKVFGYEKLGSVGLDADLPQPLTPAVRDVLKRHRIPEPTDGVLVVEIRAAGGQ